MQIFTSTDDKVDDDKHDKDNEDNDDKVDSLSHSESIRVTWDHDRFWDVIVSSEELSLLQIISPGKSQEGAQFSLHPLIRDWLQLRLKAKERANYTQEAMLVLQCCGVGYDDPSTTLEEKTALVTHMDVSLSNDKEFVDLQDRLGHKIDTCNMAFWFADIYEERCRYRTSKDLYCRILETQRIVLSEKHPDTLRTMDRLASLLGELGSYGAAEQMHRRSLTLHETELGKEHPDTLASMNNLAVTLRRQKRYAEAESMYRETLSLEETILGKEHPGTLAIMHNLASLLHFRNKYGEAEIMLGETLMLGERVLGKERPEMLRIRGSLALVLNNQDKYKEAESIYRETLVLQKGVLGKEHPDTLTSMNNLATVLGEQNKSEEAELMLRETLMLSETVLGKDHPDTRNSRDNLVIILRNQGKDEEADLVAAVGTSKQSEANTVPYPIDSSTYSHAVDLGGPSLVWTNGARQWDQISRKWEELEDDREEETGRRRVRMTRWARRTMKSMKPLRLTPKRTPEALLQAPKTARIRSEARDHCT